MAGHVSLLQVLAICSMLDGKPHAGKDAVGGGVGGGS